MTTAPQFARTRVYALAEAGIMIAAAQLLSYIALFKAPYGGTVTAGCMLPIVLLAVRRGPGWGFGAGLVFGILQQFLGGTFYTIPSLFLDYLLAYAVLGVAAFFGKLPLGLVWGGFAAGFCRFFVHFLAGIILWASYAPEGMPAALYSLLYNGGYMLPETIIICILGFALTRIKPDLAVRR